MSQEGVAAVFLTLRIATRPIGKNGEPKNERREMAADRPNDPERVAYGPERTAIVRSTGGTPSEQYLAKLADRSFLNLWSYPNTFIDKRSGGKGDGKELCDLLVVCGDHLLIFSEKTIGWPPGDNEPRSWKRWYKSAIRKSVDQIRGAERWITNFPQRIFLDRQCTQPLPLRLPPPERRKVHGIVVALGAGEACKKHFREGIGSLIINSTVKDDAVPFTIGDVDPDGPFVHVLDDATLDIVMREFDTITDFTDYLIKKERFLRSGRRIAAGGEEDLVAWYMTHTNSQDEHDFTRADGSTPESDEGIIFEPGIHADMRRNPQYRAKKDVEQVSYVWDRLIETFTTNMLAGTMVVPDGEPFVLSNVEVAVRHMALVPRYIRRIWADSILDALQRSSAVSRFTRALMPGPTESNRDTGFFFMTLAVPEFELDGGYEGYRDLRRAMLEIYALAFLQMYRQLKQVVGIATEPLSKVHRAGSSEDLILVHQQEWTPALLQDLEERKKVFSIAQEGNYKEYAVQGTEFPDVQQRQPVPRPTGLNRQARRAQAAEARRRQKQRR
jgi:hypothetical protein